MYWQELRIDCILVSIERLILFCFCYVHLYATASGEVRYTNTSTLYPVIDKVQCAININTVMATVIGSNTKIKDAMNMIVAGSNPALHWHNEQYLLSTSKRQLGMLQYTKFAKNGTAIHTVHVPYSFNDTIAMLLTRGENLRTKLPPVVDSIT